jgi:membrane protease YdiL (CAAX protease family)
LREAAVGFAVGLVLSVVTAGIAEAVVGWNGKGDPPVAVTAADVVGLWCGMVGAVVYASRSFGSASLRRDFGLWLGGWLDLVGGAAIGLACQYALIPALYWPFEQFDHTLAHRLSRPAQTDTGSVHHIFGAIVLMAFLAVGAPIVEELFFRGLVLRGLLARLHPALAIVATALLFALAHLEALQFAGLAVFGVILGFLAWRLGRLAPSIAAHAAFNAAAVASLVHLR